MEDKPNRSKNVYIKKYTKTSNVMYGFGFIGAAVYYVIHATSFWIGVLGIIKAIFWPAFLLFKVFSILHM